MASLYRYGTSKLRNESLEQFWNFQTFDFSQLVFVVHFDFSVVVAVLLQLACFDSFVVAVVVLALPIGLVFVVEVLAFYLADLDPVTEAEFLFL